MNMASTIRGPMIEAPMEFRLQPGGRRAGKSCFLQCPKCDTQAFIRRSDRVTETTTQMICHCTNSACGHTWRADIVFVHSLVPGAIDRSDLNLPECPREQVPHVVPPARAGPEKEPTFFEADTAAAEPDTGT